MTVSDPSPMAASRTQITVSSGWNSRDVSLNGRLIGVTEATPGMAAKRSISAGFRAPISPTSAMTMRPSPAWSNGVRPSARIWLFTPRISASDAPAFMTTNIAWLSPQLGARPKNKRAEVRPLLRSPGTTRAPRSQRPGTVMPGSESRRDGSCVRGRYLLAHAVSTRGEGVDAGLLLLEVLDLGRGPDLDCCQLGEVASRKMAPAGVADEDVEATLLGPAKPGQDAFGQTRLVPAIAGQDHVCVGRLLVEDVSADHGHPTAVGARVEPDRGGGKGIDVGGG